jgi:hypothetical protein
MLSAVLGPADRTLRSGDSICRHPAGHVGTLAGVEIGAKVLVGGATLMRGVCLHGGGRLVGRGRFMGRSAVGLRWKMSRFVIAQTVEG